MHNLAEESTKHLKAFTITKQGHFPVTARLYVSSCESMDGVADESVTLTVTSPPYWNAIDYERYSKDRINLTEPESIQMVSMITIHT